MNTIHNIISAAFLVVLALQVWRVYKAIATDKRHRLTWLVPSIAALGLLSGGFYFQSSHTGLGMLASVCGVGMALYTANMMKRLPKDDL